MSLRLSNKASTDTEGNFSFIFSLDPVYNEAGLLTSLIASPTIPDTQEPLMAQFKWSRIKNNHQVLIPEVNSK